MTNVLILGATGTLGSAARAELLERTDAHLTLFSRHAGSVTINPTWEMAISGSVNNEADLVRALKGQDVVFAALSGDMAGFARHIVAAMDKAGVSRLLFISSMGIYGEVPASLGGTPGVVSPVLRPYREAADVIKASDLDYTVIRPGWFVSGPARYEITLKGQPFGGHDVTVSSIADLVRRIVEDPGLCSRQSVGIDTPSE